MLSQTLITDRIRTSIEVKQRIMEDALLLQGIVEAVERITTAFRHGNKVYFCGNGGSAADAQHLAAEFSGRFYFERPSLPCEALHCNTSYMTAAGNDYGYDQIYSRLISGVARPGDVLVGISTSGNSANIVNAFTTCRKMQGTTIALTGRGGGALREGCDIWLGMPSDDTPRIQESHILVGHIICEFVEQNIFGK